MPTVSEVVQLLQTEGTGTLLPELMHMILLLGRFDSNPGFRDDSTNLKPQENSTQKGICRDLDEGEFSYRLVRLFAHALEQKGYIIGMFRQRLTRIGEVPELIPEVKSHILEIIRDQESLIVTLQLLEDVERNTKPKLRC